MFAIFTFQTRNKYSILSPINEAESSFSILYYSPSLKNVENKNQFFQRYTELERMELTKCQKMALTIKPIEPTQERIPKQIDDIYFNLTNFIMNYSRIIVHFPEQLLSTFLDEEKYKNLFEVGNSMGNNSTVTRKSWEAKIFKNYYDTSRDEDRVKYGSLLINPKSTKHSIDITNYGKCYFILNNEVKKRCTMTIGDSSQFNSASSLYTFKNIFQMLMSSKYVFDYAKDCYEHYMQGEIGYVSSYFEYIEVQIHGQLLFSRDIESIVLQDTTSDELKKLAMRFAKKNGCKYLEWEDEIDTTDRKICSYGCGLPVGW